MSINVLGYNLQGAILIKARGVSSKLKVIGDPTYSSLSWLSEGAAVDAGIDAGIGSGTTDATEKSADSLDSAGLNTSEPSNGVSPLEKAPLGE